MRVIHNIQRATLSKVELSAIALLVAVCLLYFPCWDTQISKSHATLPAKVSLKLLDALGLKCRELITNLSDQQGTKNENERRGNISVLVPFSTEFVDDLRIAANSESRILAHGVVLLSHMKKASFGK